MPWSLQPTVGVQRADAPIACHGGCTCRFQGGGAPAVDGTTARVTAGGPAGHHGASGRCRGSGTGRPTGKATIWSRGFSHSPCQTLGLLVELEDDLPDRERQMLKLIAAEPEPPVDLPIVVAADQDRPGWVSRLGLVVGRDDLETPTPRRPRGPRQDRALVRRRRRGGGPSAIRKPVRWLGRGPTAWPARRAQYPRRPPPAAPPGSG